MVFIMKNFRVFFDWSVANRLSVNTDKTLYTIISLSTTERNSLPIVTINNNQIALCNSNEFLGVTLDDKLKFNLHIAKISKKISKSLGILSKLQLLLPFDTLKNLYYSLVYHYLNYCNIIWSSTYNSHLKQLNYYRREQYALLLIVTFIATLMTYF